MTEQLAGLTAKETALIDADIDRLTEMMLDVFQAFHPPKRQAHETDWRYAQRVKAAARSNVRAALEATLRGGHV
jgi:hypothetical protein